MQLSNYAIVAAVEVYILLTIVGIGLFLYVRKQRQLILRQHEKLQYLIAQLRKLKIPSSPASSSGHNYQTYLKAQLAATKNRYAGVAPDSDITMVPVASDSAQQQALAIRYRHLLNEEAAVLNGDGPLQLDWSVFEENLWRTTGEDKSVAINEELATYKQRVENLEKFKQLFFDMEANWQDAREQAQGYHQQLSLMAVGESKQEQFTEILERYQMVYETIDSSFGDYRREHYKDVPEVASRTEGQQSVNPQSVEEIRKLRNVAADQHRIINQLQRKLEDAVTEEAKAAAVSELQQQLQRQTRFVQESETCVRLLEEELSGAMEKANKLQQLLHKSMDNADENNRLKETLQIFTQESKSLTASIFQLEQENDVLKEQLQQSRKVSTSASITESPEHVLRIKQELATLKGQYAELESKYLDLKLKN